MTENRKHLLDKFQKYVEQNYCDYCKEHELDKELEGLITYLIDHDIISNKSIQNYTIINEFKILYPQNKHQKTKTVSYLANRFNLSERSIWNVLRRGSSKI